MGLFSFGNKDKKEKRELEKEDRGAEHEIREIQAIRHHYEEWDKEWYNAMVQQRYDAAMQHETDEWRKRFEKEKGKRLTNEEVQKWMAKHFSNKQVKAKRQAWRREAEKFIIKKDTHSIKPHLSNLFNWAGDEYHHIHSIIAVRRGSKRDERKRVAEWTNPKAKHYHKILSNHPVMRDPQLRDMFFDRLQYLFHQNQLYAAMMEEHILGFKLFLSRRQWALAALDVLEAQAVETRKILRAIEEGQFPKRADFETAIVSRVRLSGRKLEVTREKLEHAA